MNLVSHEYVAAQEDVSDDEAEGEGAKQGALGEEGEGPRRRRESACCKPFAKDGPGALVLSEFAGSAQSLSGAIRVNPWNTEELARAIHEALTLTRVERELRWAKLHRYVTTNTASYWARSFVSEFRDVCEHPPLLSKLPKLNAASVLSAYSRAKNRFVAAWTSNLQPDFNLRVIDRFDARLSAALRELDESNRFVQKSAESTSI